MRLPLRALLALTVVASTAAVPAAADANVAKRHFLKMYKVQAHVDLEGDFPENTFHTHVYCDPGDWAVDGMWLVDHVDQEDPQSGVFGDMRDVQIDASYNDDFDHEEWHFRGVNNADGRAQLKLFVVCVGGRTEPNGHRHNIVVSSRHDDPYVGVPGGAFHPGHGFECGPDELAVAPGFNFTSGNGRIFRNYPSPNFRSWQWGFLVNGPADLTLYLRCLRIKTGSAGNGPHAHNILWTWRPNYAGSHRNLGTVVTRERLSCGQQEKGVVGAWWIDDPFHIWFLGMEPMIKKREYKFWNDGGGADDIYLALLCLNDRVGKQIAP